MNGQTIAPAPSTAGGLLQPPMNRVVEFGIRVSAVEGGYMINKFSEGMAVCTTLDEARKIVLDYFEATLNAPAESDKQNEEQITTAQGEDSEIIPEE